MADTPQTIGQAGKNMYQPATAAPGAATISQTAKAPPQATGPTIGQAGTGMFKPATAPAGTPSIGDVGRTAKTPEIGAGSKTIGETGKDIGKPAARSGAAVVQDKADYGAMRGLGSVERTIGQSGADMTRPLTAPAGTPSIGDAGQTMRTPQVAAGSPTIAEQGRALLQEFSGGNTIRMSNVTPSSPSPPSPEAQARYGKSDADLAKMDKAPPAAKDGSVVLDIKTMSKPPPSIDKMW